MKSKAISTLDKNISPKNQVETRKFNPKKSTKYERPQLREKNLNIIYHYFQDLIKCMKKIIKKERER